MTLSVLWGTITLLWMAWAQRLPSLEHREAERCFTAKNPACYLSRNRIGRPQLADCEGYFLIFLPGRACQHRKYTGQTSANGVCCPTPKRVSCVVAHCKIHFGQQLSVASCSDGSASEVTESWTIAKSKAENLPKHEFQPRFLQTCAYQIRLGFKSTWCWFFFCWE